MAKPRTTREVAEFLDTDTWRIQRLFEDKDVAEPPRFAGKRCIYGTQIPQIVDALRARGWLSCEESADSR